MEAAKFTFQMRLIINWWWTFKIAPSNNSSPQSWIVQIWSPIRRLPSMGQSSRAHHQIEYITQQMGEEVVPHKYRGSNRIPRGNWSLCHRLPASGRVPLRSRPWTLPCLYLPAWVLPTEYLQASLIRSLSLADRPWWAQSLENLFLGDVWAHTRSDRIS